MAQLDEDTKARVLKQIEFYFSDSNLPKDKFLKEKIASDADKYVDLNIIIAFARMRDILKLKISNPSEVPEDVVKAVAEVLHPSSLLDVHAEGKRVRRKEPLKDDATIAAEIDARSLYAKPFPMDADVDKLTQFFSQYSKVNCIRMRRVFSTKTFKGSVFVEFGSVEEAEKVLGMQLEYGGAPLQLEKKLAYLERKKAERKAHAKSADGAEAHNVEDGDEGSNDELPDGAGGQAGHRSAEEAVGKGKKRQREQEGGEGADDEEGAEEWAGKGPEFTPGSLLAFTVDSELPELVGPKTISDVLGGRDVVKWVELNEDKKGGFLHFHSVELAQKALDDFNAKGDNDKVIAGSKGTMRKVEGEEEVNFHKMRAEKFADRRSHRGGRGGRGRGRGGRGRGGRGGGGRGKRGRN